MKSWQITVDTDRSQAFVVSSFNSRVAYGKLRRALQRAKFSVGNYTPGVINDDVIRFTFTVEHASHNAMMMFLLSHADVEFQVTEL